MKIIEIQASLNICFRKIIGKNMEKPSKTIGKMGKTIINHWKNMEKPTKIIETPRIGQEECLQVEQRLTPLLQTAKQRIDAQEEELKLVAGRSRMWRPWGTQAAKMGIQHDSTNISDKNGAFTNKHDKHGGFSMKKMGDLSNKTWDFISTAKGLGNIDAFHPRNMGFNQQKWEFTPQKIWRFDNLSNKH